SSQLQGRSHEILFIQQSPCEEQGSHSPPKPIGGQFSQYAENAQRECGGGMHGVHPLFWLRKIRTRVIDSPATRLPVT
ncbi:hypothetical protein, partial [Citrobacter portucalensis]